MPAHRKDYDAAVKMYQGGMSIALVAKHFGCTRQSMYMVLRRRKVAFRNRLRYGAMNHFYQHGLLPDTRVHSIVSKAVAHKRLLPAECEQCGSMPISANGRRLVDAHHDDYNFPLSVRWLCHECHRQWHQTHEPVRRTRPLPPMPRAQICSMGGTTAWNNNRERGLAQLKRARRKRRSYTQT